MVQGYLALVAVDRTFFSDFAMERLTLPGVGTPFLRPAGNKLCPISAVLVYVAIRGSADNSPRAPPSFSSKRMARR